MMSEWPFRYLVVECMTTSAPSSRGRWLNGEANVLSTIRIRDPSVVVSKLRLRHRRLHVCGGLEDRHHDRACGRLGLLAAKDRQRAEAKAGFFGHRDSAHRFQDGCGPSPRSARISAWLEVCATVLHVVSPGG
jgi:hypothetical protein